MKRMLVCAAALTAAAFLAPAPSSAASFDCALAALPAEEAICDDGMLEALDEDLAAEYLALLETAPPDAVFEIREEQRLWVRERNACGYDPDCLVGVYRYRLDELGAWRELVRVAPRELPAGPTGFLDGPEVIPFDGAYALE